MKKLFFLCWIISAGAHAQQPPVIAQEQLEHLADANGIETQKDNEYLQQLEEYTRHPLSVNTASAEELTALHLINDIQIEALLSYRKLLGALIDIHELQAVPGWDVATIERAVPYLTTTVSIGIVERLAARLKGNQVLLLRTGRVLQKPKGYGTDSGNHYLGSPDHLLVSYKYQYKNLLYFGATADKDPGEQFFRGAQSKGFDFYSVHFFARNLGWIKALALGDYTVNLGQGLVQWQSDGFGKTAAVLSVKKMAPVLAPYRSAGESGFNRGFGITLARKGIELSFFGSYKKISGSVDTALKNFGSLQTIGYYRTPAELANRYKLGLWSWGGHLTYNKKGFELGLSALKEEFSLPWQKKEEPYNYFAFSGKKLFDASINWSYAQKNRHWFGEAAVGRNLNKAVLAGVIMSVDPKIDLAFFYRNLSPKYQAVEGSAFTESSLPSNEKGFYAGMVFRPAIGWQLSAYADCYRFPWLRYRVNSPGMGCDYLLEVLYQPEKRWALTVRYRSKYQLLNSSDGVVLAFPEGRTSEGLRVHLANQITPRLAVKTRVELVGLKGGQGREEGFLIYEEASCRILRWLKADVRLQYTETGSYDSRIYGYESDVLYSFSIPAYFGKMYRYYLNININTGKRLGFWVKLADSFYPEATTVGSGLDIIAGHQRTDVKFQMIYRWP